MNQSFSKKKSIGAICPEMILSLFINLIDIVISSA